MELQKITQSFNLYDRKPLNVTEQETWKRFLAKLPALVGYMGGTKAGCGHRVLCQFHFDM